jgi:hypothetical protein
MFVAFSTTRKGRRIAFRCDHVGMNARRMSMIEAEVAIATGAATEVMTWKDFCASKGMVVN